jgi:hypothetical protein
MYPVFGQEEKTGHIKHGYEPGLRPREENGAHKTWIYARSPVKRRKRGT